MPIKQNELNTLQQSFLHYQLLTYQDHSMNQDQHKILNQLIYPKFIRKNSNYLQYLLQFSKNQHIRQPIQQDHQHPIHTLKYIWDEIILIQLLSFKDISQLVLNLHHNNYHILNNRLSNQNRFQHRFLHILKILVCLGMFQNQHQNIDQI